MDSLINMSDLLLAEVGSGPAIHALPRHATFGWAAVALAAGALALLLLSVMSVSWLLSASARRETNHPQRLLRELCAAHGLSRRQQQCLATAAGALRIQQPSRFFLEPGLLQEAAGSPKLRAKRVELWQIGKVLFDSAPQQG